MENKTYYSFVVIFALIFGSSILTINYYSGTYVFVPEYNAEEDGGYWSVIPDDILMYELSDTYLSNYSYSVNKALLKQQIISINDLGNDYDSYPDLLLKNDYLLGNTSFEPILNDYFNIDFLFRLASTAFSVAQLINGNDAKIRLPAISELDMVSSTTIDFIEFMANRIMILENSMEALHIEDLMPGYSFDFLNTANFTEMNNTLNYLITQLGLNGDTLPISMVTLDNYKRFGSTGLKLTGNTTITTSESPTTLWWNFTESGPDFDKRREGVFSGYFVTPTGNNQLYLYIGDRLNATADSLGSDSIGVKLLFNATGGYYFPGTYTYDSNTQSWILSGNNLEPVLFIDNENYQTTKMNRFEIDLHGFANLNSYATYIPVNLNEEEYGASFQILRPPDYSNEYWCYMNMPKFFGFGAKGQVIIDDVKISSGEFLDDLYFTDFPLMTLLETITPSTLRFLPRILDYDQIMDFVGYVGMIIDLVTQGFLHVNFHFYTLLPTFFINTPTTFGFYLKGSVLEAIINNLGIQALGFTENLTSFIQGQQGRTNWEYLMTYDKQLGIMNESTFRMDFLDVGYSRILSQKLIATRSPREAIDGYSFIAGSWYSDHYFVDWQPSEVICSLLNDDIYPNEIPDEWSIHSTFPDGVGEVFNITEVQNITQVENVTLIENITQIEYIIQNNATNSTPIDYEAYIDEYMESYLESLSQEQEEWIAEQEAKGSSIDWGANWVPITGVSVLLVGVSSALSLVIKKFAD